MGRNRVRYTEPVDTGEPGKFYFIPAELVEIEGKNKPAPIVHRFHGNNESSTYGEGACRLQSSHNIMGYIPPTDCVYELTRWPNREDYNEYLARKLIDGFDEGTIVAKRHQPRDQFFRPVRWGVIIMCHDWSPSRPLFPFVVRWFQEEKAEQAFAEDLVVIHAAMDNEYLATLLEAQDIDLETD